MPNYKALLTDIDGTIYFKGKLIQGVKEFLQELKQKGVCIRYLTNTASIPLFKIKERLAGYGLEVLQEEVFNPIAVAKVYFEKHANFSIYCMASKEIQAEFQNGNWNDKNPSHVLVGDIQEACGYDEINRIFQFLDNGSRLMATSYSSFFYSSNGEKTMDTGAVVKMFESVLNIKAEIIGKPSPLFYQMTHESTGREKSQCIAVGDDIETDILGANQYGLYSVLVQTGKYDASVKNLKTIPKAILPDLTHLVKYF